MKPLGKKIERSWWYDGYLANNVNTFGSVKARNEVEAKHLLSVKYNISESRIIAKQRGGQK